MTKVYSKSDLWNYYCKRRTDPANVNMWLIELSAAAAMVVWNG